MSQCQDALGTESGELLTLSAAVDGLCPNAIALVTAGLARLMTQQLQGTLVEQRRDMETTVSPVCAQPPNRPID